jgi:uncharacterized membrane protein
VAALLALTGVVIAAYLGGYQVGWWHRVWDPFFGEMSTRVLRSGLSRTLPVPDAWVGAAAYLVEAVLELSGGPLRWREQPRLTAANIGLVVLMGVGSVGLVAAQALVIHAWCTLCLASAGISFMIVALSRHEIRAVVMTLERRRA